jgi:hypothetical protein
MEHPVLNASRLVKMDAAHNREYTNSYNTNKTNVVIVFSK